MPAGLDGNPDPVRTPERTAVLRRVASEVTAVVEARRPGCVLVGVDGRSGSGKSTFADELARLLAEGGHRVERSTVDSFHNDRATRYRRGRGSPEGYYRDSHDLDAVVRELLEPFRSGRGRYRTAVFDEPADAPVHQDPLPVVPGTVLVFDGLFLHRPELRSYWDVSVLLEADRRMVEGSVAWAEREASGGGDAALLRFLWWWSHAHRYLEGWQRYVEECDPVARASLVIVNDDLTEPRIVAAH